MEILLKTLAVKRGDIVVVRAPRISYEDAKAVIGDLQGSLRYMGRPDVGVCVISDPNAAIGVLTERELNTLGYVKSSIASALT